MACWAKIDAGQPIRNGGAYGNAPESKSTQVPVMQGTPELLEPGNYHAVLDARYKVGGTTTWERPAQA